MLVRAGKRLGGARAAGEGGGGAGHRALHQLPGLRRLGAPQVPGALRSTRGERQGQCATCTVALTVASRKLNSISALWTTAGTPLATLHGR